jgi:hypothetical protein
MPVTPKPPAARQAPPQPAQQTISPIASTIQKAAQATGASFEYLLATAKVESNLKPNLKAKTSSATGLFQFIEQTWFAMMKQAGKTLGFARYSDAITQTRSGKYQVANPELRNEILQLRQDPSANATMAGVFTKQNAAVLGKRIGRVPTNGELYIAHFFGPGGASKLINATSANPNSNAAQLFPAAARANRSIFYDKQGHARSLAGVYGELDRRYQVARATTAPHVAPVRVAETTAPTVPAAPDTAATSQAFAVASAQRVEPVVETKPVFRSLFQTNDARPAVSPVVAELWTSPAVRTDLPGPVAAVTAAAPTPSGVALDLFQDSRPNVRALFDRSA